MGAAAKACESLERCSLAVRFSIGREGSGGTDARPHGVGIVPLRVEATRVRTM
jgi:hypothetical protein